jgi:hypothetical protein
MATSTKWRLHFTANNSTPTNGVGFGDLQMRTTAGVARPWVKASVDGTVTHLGSATLYGSSGLTALDIGNFSAHDDSIHAITLPFPINFGSVPTSTVWVSTNGYLVFSDPGGVDVHGGFTGANPARPSLQIGANDGRADNIYYGSLDGNATFRIRFEGNSSYNSSGTAEVWEITLTAATPDSIRLDSQSGPGFGGRGIGDGNNSTYVATFTDGLTDASYSISTSGTPDEASATASSAKPSGPPYDYNPPSGINGLWYDQWRSVEGGSSIDEWFQVEFTYPFTCAEYVLTIWANTGLSPNPYIPTAWTLEYWNGAAWAVADTRSGVDMTSTGNDDWTYTLTYCDGDVHLSPLTLNAFANITGDYVDIVLEELALAATLVHAAAPVATNPMTGDSFFPELELDASLEPALALAELQLAASGYAGNVGDALLTLPTWTLKGATADGLILPQLSLDATGDAAALITADITLPQLALAGALDAALPLPGWTLDGALLAGTVSAAQLTLPVWTALGDCGLMADVTLPDLAVDGAGLAGTVASGAISMPVWLADTSAYQDTTSSGNVTFGLLSVAGGMLSDALIDASVTLPLASLSATGLAGTVSGATLTLPLFTLDGHGYFDNIGTASVELLALLVNGTLDNDQPLAATVPTLALNTVLRAVTLYDGVLANSYASFNGLTLAATEHGIVALSGDTDLGAAIRASVMSGISDLDSPQLKRVLSGFVGYRASGAMSLTLITDEHHEYVYQLDPRQIAADLHPSRVKLGRGVTGRYWQWALDNRDGADFSLDNFTMEVEPLKRRI